MPKTRPKTPAKLHVKKGDLVEVIAGKDKGRQGVVISTDPRKGRVIVEGVNRIVKHTKITQGYRGAQQGGIVHKEAPVHASNVMLVDADAKERARPGYRLSDQGEKIRISRRTGKDI